MKHQPTINDVMEVLQEFSGSMDVQIKGVKQDLVTLQQKVASIEKNMVTKTYLDGKLGDLHAYAQGR